MTWTEKPTVRPNDAVTALANEPSAPLFGVNRPVDEMVPAAGDTVHVAGNGCTFMY